MKGLQTWDTVNIVEFIPWFKHRVSCADAYFPVMLDLKVKEVKVFLIPRDVMIWNVKKGEDHVYIALLLLELLVLILHVQISLVI